MLRELWYQFLPYRSMLFPFLVASAIAVPCWLLFRINFRRSRRQSASFTREVLLLIFVVYLAGLASATLTPNRSTRLVAEGRGGIDLRPNLGSLTCSAAHLPGGANARGFCMRNARGNLALFFPLGLLIPLVWRRLRFRSAILVVIGVSFTIELLQYLSSALGSYRAADVNDFILNVFGATLGLLLMYVLLSLLRLGPRQRTAVTPA